MAAYARCEVEGASVRGSARLLCRLLARPWGGLGTWTDRCACRPSSLCTPAPIANDETDVAAASATRPRTRHIQPRTARLGNRLFLSFWSCAGWLPSQDSQLLPRLDGLTLVLRACLRQLIQLHTRFHTAFERPRTLFAMHTCIRPHTSVALRLPSGVVKIVELTPNTYVG